ncbi:hypothetical protein GF339_12540 [candidate division KSB3 bacterium]|uniref:Flagellar biosynthesis protein FlgA n=1 Tax=candidate division KSB3 bacterium TaxID=2044937 RepID=A0A9D5Q672_9BACT|nr:hypothetical protein [candidate division KSB3 bacterium]MBD3325410.1 hypothetical protein [candidate division KSB3 bacterium]
MIYEHLFENAAHPPVKAGLIGTGTYGMSLFSQSQAISRLEIPVICDQDLDAAHRACQEAGIPPENIAICHSRSDALQAMERGKYAVIEDYILLMDLPLEVIIECTGHPEAGARHVESAIQHGKHVAMVNKETDSVIGPLLHARAAQAGVVYTPVEGDQHGLLIGLVSWARTLGLEVICGGKARARDFVYDEAQATVTDGVTTATLTPDEMQRLREIPTGKTAHVVKIRRKMLHTLPQIAEGDLCESVVAANATGLIADTPTLHAPIVRTTEIPEVLCPRAEGGILDRTGTIDVITCLRRPDEAGLAGGVFLVFACKNAYAWEFLQEKGIIANRQGTCGLIYRPYHLLGVETPISVLCAGLLHVSTGGITVQPIKDLVARAACDLRAGSSVQVVGADGRVLLEPLMIPAVSIGEGTPLPLYMAVGNRLKQNVAAGTILTHDMIAPPSDSRLWTLRAEQDQPMG